MTRILLVGAMTFALFAGARFDALAGDRDTVALASVCNGTPVSIQGNTASAAFSETDVKLFDQSIALLKADVERTCTKDKNSARLFKSKAHKVVFTMAAGATEPHVYLDDETLIVEFYGGTFDSQAFRTNVRNVLRGRAPKIED